MQIVPKMKYLYLNLEGNFEYKKLVKSDKKTIMKLINTQKHLKSYIDNQNSIVKLKELYYS